MAFVTGRPALGLTLGIVLGALYGLTTRPTQAGYAGAVMTMAAMGIPVWGLISVVAVPVSSGQLPEWTAEGMRAHFPGVGGVGAVWSDSGDRGARESAM